MEKKLEEYRTIYLKEESERSGEEKRKLSTIEDELNNLPMWENEKDKTTKGKG